MATTVEMNEQTVPLKSSETEGGNVETGAGATSAGEEAAKTTKEKKSWFGGGKKKPKADEAKPETGTTEGISKNGPNEKGKKPKFPFSLFKPAAADVIREPTFDVNLIQRDDHNLQTFINLGYEDIYGEPDPIHSFDGVWRSNYKLFVKIRAFFYKLFSLILFIPSAVVFGILFALFSVLSVFLLVPIGKLLSIPCIWLFKVWSFVVSAVLDPVFRSISYLFSSVKITRYGINNDPTDVITG